MTNRIGRVEYLLWNLLLVLGFALLLVLIVSLVHQESLALSLGLAPTFGLFYVKLLLVTKRLHDTNSSAWWALVLFIPLFGAAFDLILFFKPGTRDANNYGPAPRTWPWEQAQHHPVMVGQSTQRP